MPRYYDLLRHDPLLPNIPEVAFPVATLEWRILNPHYMTPEAVQAADANQITFTPYLNGKSIDNAYRKSFQPLWENTAGKRGPLPWRIRRSAIEAHGKDPEKFKQFESSYLDSLMKSANRPLGQFKRVAELIKTIKNANIGVSLDFIHGGNILGLSDGFGFVDVNIPQLGIPRHDPQTAKLIRRQFNMQGFAGALFNKLINMPYTIITRPNQREARRLIKEIRSKSSLAEQEMKRSWFFFLKKSFKG